MLFLGSSNIVAHIKQQILKKVTMRKRTLKEVKSMITPAKALRKIKGNKTVLVKPIYDGLNSFGAISRT